MIEEITRNTPYEGDYDYGYGVDPSLIDYIRESIVVQSRISSTRCYLLQRNLSPSGSIGSEISPIALDSFSQTTPNYRGIIWSSGSIYPDTRISDDGDSGKIHVYIDGVEATRVIEVDDIEADNEFAVVERFDLGVPRVEVVLNEGFIPTGAITYWYPHLNQGIRSEHFKQGESIDGSLYGWSQWLDNTFDDFKGRHQILVRLPLTTRDLKLSEEGKVILEENQSWMIWTPYVNDYDILILPAGYTRSGLEERYEVVNKQDSVIQGSLISQRFKLKLIEADDLRQNIMYTTSRT